MKKTNLRTTAFGVVLGLSLALGLGFGTTVLSAAVSAPVAEQSQTCDKPEACPVQDATSCPMGGGNGAQASTARHSCPVKGNNI